MFNTCTITSNAEGKFTVTYPVPGNPRGGVIDNLSEATANSMARIINNAFAAGSENAVKTMSALGYRHAPKPTYKSMWGDF